MWLKQGTAQTIRFGPFLDSDDGFTPDDGLTIAQADRQLSKDGGQFAQTSDTNNASHDTDGWYSCSLTTDDTDTLGELLLQATVADVLPVWMRWLVVPANVYDSLVGGTDRLVSHVQEFDAGVITATVIATDAIGSDELAASAVSEIQSGLSTSSALATLQSAVNALNNISAADVNAQVLDVLNVDQFAELTDVPGASPTLRQMLQHAFMVAFNKLEQSTSTLTVYQADGVTAYLTRDISDENSVFSATESADA